MAAENVFVKSSLRDVTLTLDEIYKKLPKWFLFKNNLEDWVLFVGPLSLINHVIQDKGFLSFVYLFIFLSFILVKYIKVRTVNFFLLIFWKKSVLFCGTIDAPVLDYRWHLILVSKPEWAALFTLSRSKHVEHFWDSHLVQHLLSSWWPAWQPSHSVPCTCKQAFVGLETSTYQATTHSMRPGSRSTDWATPVCHCLNDFSLFDIYDFDFKIFWLGVFLTNVWLCFTIN